MDEDDIRRLASEATIRYRSVAEVVTGAIQLSDREISDGLKVTTLQAIVDTATKKILEL
jgi:hypothetical protein